MQRLSRLETVFAISVLAGCIAAVAPAQTTYTITDLGTLPGGSSSIGLGINASGQVTGASDTTSGTHAFLYSNGTMTDLGTFPDGTFSQGDGINASGQVTGYGNGPGFINNHAFLNSGGTLLDLGTLPGGSYSLGFGINTAGRVVGNSDGPGFFSHAFLYSGGTMTDLGTLPTGLQSGASGINTAGQVVGVSGVNGFINHAFLYSGGTMTDLNTLIPANSGWILSSATAINDSGQITGQGALNSDPGFGHAFLYSSGEVIDLGTLPGSVSFCESTGINNSGQVVGFCEVTRDGFLAAFLYSSGTMTELNTLLPANSGWTLRFAYAINDAGQITGQGTNPNGAEHAFLLTPVPTITALANLVQSFNLPFGIANSLLVKLQAAEAAGPGSAGCADLSAFISEVQAQSGKKLTTAQATQLIPDASQIKVALDCP
jgi:probable HAF family extracellular repeat protein